MAIAYTKTKGLFASSKMVILLTMGFSLVVLLFSYSAQYIWGIEPCRLCKLQRIPYFFVIIFSALAFLPRYRKIAVRIIQVSLLLGLGLAGYHLLVMAGIVADPCSVPKGIVSIEDFQSLLNAPLPCSKVAWRLLGIPLAGYNVLLSTFFLCFLMNGKNRRRCTPIFSVCSNLREFFSK